MQLVVNILTMIAFAVHAVMGCCVHHVHAAAEAGHSQTALQQHFVPQDCCHYHGDITGTDITGTYSHNGEESGQPEESGPCKDVSCAFSLEPAFRVSEFVHSFASLMYSPRGDVVIWAESLPASPMKMAVDFCHFRLDSQTMRASLQCWLV